MLDTKSRLVLKFLNKECNEGTYKIIDTGDIISALPSKYKVDTDGLEQIMDYLENKDLITIKYSDDSVYCLSVLPLAREVLEAPIRVHKKDKHKNISSIVYILTFASGLIGAFLGAIIVKFLF